MPYAEQVDLICDQFERDWKANRKPDAREYSELAAPLYRERVLRELILTERECVLFVKVPSTSPHKPSTSDTQPEYLDNWKSDTKVESPPSKLQRDRSIPSHIDRYLIRKVLGEGSHGIVYEAEDVEIRKCVALKVNKNLGTMNRSLEREASIASRIEHPAIVGVLNCGQFGDYSYLATEMVRGVNLKHFANGKMLDPRVASEIMIQIANAIHAAHQSGVIHRDLKPSNIMVVSASRTDEPFVDKHLLSSDQNDISKIEKLSIRILDFGVAKSDDRLTVTNEGSIIGTPHYMSPEQASGNTSKISARSDIFSMGIIFYELLTGDVPFNGQTMVVLRAISEVQVPSVGLAKPDLPSGLVKIVDKCLCLDISQRYLTAKQLEDDLHAWINGVRNTSTRPTLRHNSLVWTTAVSILCMALIGIVTVYSGTRQPESISGNHFENEASTLLAGWVNDGNPDQFAKWLELDSPKSLPMLEDIEPVDSWRLELAKLCESGSELGIESVNPDVLYENIAERSQENWEPIFAKCNAELLAHLARKATSERRGTIRLTLVETLSKSLSDREESAALLDLLTSVRPDDLPTVLTNVRTDDVGLAEEISRRFSKYREMLDSTSRFAVEDDVKICGRLGLAAYKLGKWEIVERVISFAVDPRARTTFIREFSDSGLNVKPLVDRFPSYSDDWIATAVVECYIGQNSDAEPKTSSNEFIQFLKNAFRTHPSAGVHWMAMGALNTQGQAEWVDEMVATQEWQDFDDSRNWFHLEGRIPMSTILAPMVYYFGFDGDQSTTQSTEHQLAETFAISAIPLTVDHLHWLTGSKAQSRDNEMAFVSAQSYCEELATSKGKLNRVFMMTSAWEWECAIRAGTKAVTWEELCIYQDKDFGFLNPKGVGFGFDNLVGELCCTDIQSLQPSWSEGKLDLIVFKGGRERRDMSRRLLPRNGYTSPAQADRFGIRLVIKSK
jgi:serine/threonine protein kinase